MRFRCGIREAAGDAAGRQRGEPMPAWGANGARRQAEVFSFLVFFAADARSTPRTVAPRIASGLLRRFRIE